MRAGSFTSRFMLRSVMMRGDDKTSRVPVPGSLSLSTAFPCCVPGSRLPSSAHSFAFMLHIAIAIDRKTTLWYVRLHEAGYSASLFCQFAAWHTSHCDDIARVVSSVSSVCHASAYYAAVLSKVENMRVQGLSMAIPDQRVRSGWSIRTREQPTLSNAVMSTNLLLAD